MTLAYLLLQYDMKNGTVDNESDLSVTQRLQQRDRDGLDRFVITNNGPWVSFRQVKSS
jgi:hypothetical protein